MRLLLRVGSLVVSLAILVELSQAQDIRGKISGTVTDPQGASVAGATVDVINTDTNVSTPLVTNSSGFYEAPLLLPGPYKVSAAAPGFKTTLRPNLSGSRTPATKASR